MLNKADDMNARGEAGRVKDALAAVLEDPVVITSSHLAWIEREAMSDRDSQPESGARASR